jgi:hypothetical protein
VCHHGGDFQVLGARQEGAVVDAVVPLAQRLEFGGRGAAGKVGLRLSAPFDDTLGSQGSGERGTEVG